jgi:hypothetical protein
VVGFLEPAAGVGSWKEPPLEEGVAALCTARSLPGWWRMGRRESWGGRRKTRLTVDRAAAGGPHRGGDRLPSPSTAGADGVR